MSGVTLHAREDVFPVAGSFTIARGSRTEIRVVTVTLDDGTHRGHGESVPYARYNETVDGVIADIMALEGAIAAGMDRIALQTRLPGGAARNALDCAFWDLEAKRTGKPVWQLAGLDAPAPLMTAYTISLGTPEKMRSQAAENAHRPLLKVKLGADGDLERIEAVRAGAPNADIIVDANEGWSVEAYRALAPTLVRLGVKLVEQPLPAGKDEALKDIARPLPVCADESCHDRKSLADLIGKYDAINIKIDKTGGLTEALALKAEAEKAGFQIMTGCMLGTSLAMAPAMLVGQNTAFVDLDGPLLIAADREHPIRFEGSKMYLPEPALWG
ncbi:N-acetyl-D-Glu racemase DgcA [Martelella sp. HB161492]|uniref:N-acetyl-D-Glu racemase DgcA n=1 Tax=Martelella sp. HB161492 TaxID=2720726 RepID=UPI001590CB34|nr:N-acetyl-D-Glu racemase DgcA [Martelella sp. HB161492]